jgi:SAM-dependent methyltransferase
MIEHDQLRTISLAIREAFARGENVMEFARRTFGQAANTPLITLMAYDLQAGSYISGARKDPEYRRLWCGQVAGLLNRFIGPGDTLLEVGSGEATTLAGVLNGLSSPPREVFGFDISWSRCAHGAAWLREKDATAQLFVGDLFNIPFEDDSIDVVYTSHSLEPNGGREKEAIRELLRVARKAVVLIEPAFEFASEEARQRMVSHGYVRNLRGAAEALGAEVVEHTLLKVYGNPLNPSGCLSLVKSDPVPSTGVRWRCPVTHVPLCSSVEAFVAENAGLVYPVLGGIPLLRSEHAVVASAFHTVPVFGGVE